MIYTGLLNFPKRLFIEVDQLTRLYGRVTSGSCPLDQDFFLNPCHVASGSCLWDGILRPPLGVANDIPTPWSKPLAI